jgi:hypothetical protein
MAKQYTLKVYPSGWGREAYRIIEICGKDTLDDLCSAILDSFDFIDEHLYEFCMDNRMYSDYSYQSDPEYGQDGTDIMLDNIELSKGQKFSLHYDFGDDWMFVITVNKIQNVDNYHKPMLIKSKGSVSQYPDWDEEDDWEDE